MMKIDPFAYPPRLGLAPLDADAEKKRKRAQPLLIEDDALSPESEKAPTPVEEATTAPEKASNAYRYNAPDFSDNGLMQSLSLDGEDDAPARNASATEGLSEFSMLATVQKRQDGQPIYTQDILDDFLKTAEMLGADTTLRRDMVHYFGVVQSEVNGPKAEIALVKKVLMRLAKRLDTQVSETLGEPSQVVEDWLEALFTQPVEWTPVTQDAQAQIDRLPRVEGNPEGQNTTAKQSEMGGLIPIFLGHQAKKTKRALQKKAWQTALNEIETVMVHHAALPESARDQWGRLHIKVLGKLGESAKVIERSWQLGLEKDARIVPLLAEAYAKSGQPAEAIRHLYPHTLGLQNKRELKQAALVQWQSLSAWSRVLENPALEAKMLHHLWKALPAKPDNATLPKNMDAPLQRLQTLHQANGKTEAALAVSKYRVGLSKAGKNRAAYELNMRELASLFLGSGRETEALRILSLLKRG